MDYHGARVAAPGIPEANSILLPSPNWPTIDTIEPLEREFGVRVMTASQAAIWDALRLAGITDRITGYGRLLADFIDDESQLARLSMRSLT